MASPLAVERPSWMTEDLVLFEDSTRRFFEKECVPHNERWMKQQQVDRAMWTKAGEAGLLLVSAPEEFGGAGGDFRHEAVIIEQQGKLGVDGFGVTLHNAIVAPYITHYGSEEQKR